MPARFDVVMLGMAGMAMGGMRMMRGLLVIPGFVVLGGFAMMPRRMLMMFSRLLVMLHTLVSAHVSLPVRWRSIRKGLLNSPDNLLTASRQFCCD